jgi:cytochrome c553
MFRRSYPLFLAFIFVIVLILSEVNISAVSAQSEAPPSDTTCATCHENLYLLHDTGKWYCSCKRRADCTVCHAGLEGAYDKELAHQGLIANPIQNNIAACKSCHGEDYDQYIERFALMAGVSQSPSPGPTYVPVNLDIEAQFKEPGALVFIGKSYAAWQLVGLGLVMGLLFSVFVFGCRCWRQDRAEGRL